MPPTGAPYDLDWIWSFDSNTHISTHLDWFTPASFKPITSPSQITSSLPSSPHTIEGIGSVTLEIRKTVQKSNRSTGPKTSTITLKNVLYIPSFPCNVMGNPIREDYDVSIGAERWLMDKKNGKGIGLLDKTPESGLVKVLLKGQAKGLTQLSGKGVPDRIGAVWSEEEKGKGLKEVEEKEKMEEGT